MAGFARPEAQLAAACGASASTVPVSPENLGGHDAGAVAALPTFAALPAVRAGKVATADGEMWSGGTALATWWLLADLEVLAAGGTAFGNVEDAAGRAVALDAARRCGQESCMVRSSRRDVMPSLRKMLRRRV